MPRIGINHFTESDLQRELGDQFTLTSNALCHGEAMICGNGMILNCADSDVGSVAGDLIGYDFEVGGWGQCDHDGEWYRDDELRELPNGDIVNQDYFDDVAFTCDYCNQSTWIDDARSDDYNTYCEGCFCEFFTYCYGCDRVIGRDNVICIHGEWHCRGCVPDTRVQYFDGVSKNFSGDNSFGSSRSFGIEIETEGGRCREDLAFSGTDDGSIDGTEYVSHVLRGDEGLAELEALIDSGEDIDITSSCGVHLHVNVSDLSDDERYAVFAAYVALQDKWFSMVDLTRQRNSFCNKWDEGIVRDAFACHAAREDFREFSSNRNRYYWMNLSAFGKHNTLENRLHHGSWDYQELRKWIVLNLRFVRAARTLRIRCGETVESFRTVAKLALEWAKGSELSLPACWTSEPQAELVA